jgi:uncharacterized membrane protein YfcA
MPIIESLLSTQSLLLFIVAVIANALSAMAGGGAGLLQLPILLFMGLPFGVALATHKMATVALGLGSTLRYRSEKLIDLKLAFIILAFGLPGVILGAAVILRISETIATMSLGILTLGLSFYSMCQADLGQSHQPKNRHPIGLVVGGMGILLIGFTNGSLTSGTGLFATLWFIRWFGMDYQRAVAMTMVLVGIFWNGTGAITLTVLGEVKWEWVLPLVLGSLVGGYFGANVAVQQGNRWIKRVFEGLTGVTGLLLIIKVF